MREKTFAEFRASARNALSGNWGIAIVAGIVASLLGGGGSGGGAPSIDTEDRETLAAFFESNPTVDDVLSELAGFWVIFGTFVIVGIAIALLFAVAFFLLGSIVEVGYARFNMNLIDGKYAGLDDLFAYFRNWKTLVAANFLRSLYVFVWSLLCVIPGIIASYSYAMVPYIMADNPEMKASEALEASKKMMDGNKMRLFCLTFSFIGWAILCVFTCGIGGIVLTPYVEATMADFYREISGTRPVKETIEEAPIV